MTAINKRTCAGILGISMTGLYYHIRKDPNYLPLPIGRLKGEDMYDEEDIKAMACAKKAGALDNGQVTFHDIHTSMIMSNEQKQLYKMKKLRAKLNNPLTQLVATSFKD